MIAAGVVVALLADLVTASVSREANPLMRPIVTVAALAVSLKVAEIALVLAVMAANRPPVRQAIGIVAIVAGLAGAYSNVR